jgi:hypothetical protein
MECGNGRATMVKLDIVHVSYFGGLLSVGSGVSFEQYMLFMLCFAKKGLQGGRQQLMHTGALLGHPTAHT